MGQSQTFTRENYDPAAARFAGIASMVTVMVLIVAKAITYWLSGSASIYASLMDSLADATVSAMSFLALHLSLKPADKNHRSGHGKVEGLAALFQALLIFIAGLSLLWESTNRFLHPQPISHHLLAVAIMGFSILATSVLVAIQNRALRSAPSLAVEADKAHYSMDILVNSGVILVLLAIHMGAPDLVDPIFAFGVVGYLGMTALRIGGQGINMLLDRELPKPTRNRILEIIREQPGVLGVHDLRTSQSGMRINIIFDIEADPDLSLRAAHEITRIVEQALLQEFAHADIMIHVDPHGDTDDSRHLVQGVHH